MDEDEFCTPGLQTPLSHLDKTTFCGKEINEQRAVLKCSSATTARELLRSFQDFGACRNLKLEPSHFLEDGHCGQLLQDKLGENCDPECQRLDDKITKAAAEVEEVYDQKKKEVDVMESLMVEFQKKIKSVVEIAVKTKGDVEAIRNDLEKKKNPLLEKIQNNEILTPEKKNEILASVNELSPGSDFQKVIADAENEITLLKYQQASLDTSRSKMRKHFDKVKLNWKALRGDKTGTVQKSAAALDSIIGSVAKFKKGGAMDVVGGILDISNAIAQFLPPPASTITGALSSVFQLFGGRPPSTEDVIKKGFEKQKKWMETKFGELDTKLTNLETSIVNMITSEALKQREEIRVKEMKQLCNKAGGIPVDSITASLFVWNWLS